MPLPPLATHNGHIPLRSHSHSRHKARPHRAAKRAAQSQTPEPQVDLRREAIEKTSSVEDNELSIVLSSPVTVADPLANKRVESGQKHSAPSPTGHHVHPVSPTPYTPGHDAHKTVRARHTATTGAKTPVAKPKGTSLCTSPFPRAASDSSIPCVVLATAESPNIPEPSTTTAEAPLPNYFLQPARPRIGGVGLIAKHLGSALPLASRPQLPRPTFSTRRVPMKTANLDKTPSDEASNTTLSTVPRSTSRSPCPAPISRLPDLNAIVPRPPPVPSPSAIGHNGLPTTKPFSLLRPPYTDADIPLPKPYNPAYPHPLTAYASPGVNPASVYHSGYGVALMQLIELDPDLVKGEILAASDRVDIAVPSLTLCLAEGEGNGIPERLWSRFESFGAARLPIGLPAAPAYPRTTPGRTLPPRFSMPTDASPAWLVTTPGSCSPVTVVTPRDASSATFDKSDDYFTHGLRHASSASELHHDAMNADYIARSRSELDVPSTEQLYTSSSPWHKTELCRGWIETGGCRYGLGCQFAHGLEELRRSVPHPSQSLYPRKASPASHASQPPPNPKLSYRRASIAPANLAAVPELDDDLHHLFPHQAPSKRDSLQATHQYLPAPMGRPAPEVAGDRMRKTVSWFDNDEAWLGQVNRDAEPVGMITPRQSSSSLSTSSSSRASLWTNTSPALVHTHTVDDEWYGPPPVENAVSFAWDGRRELNKADTQGLTSLEFSAGRSIWC